MFLSSFHLSLLRLEIEVEQIIMFWTMPYTHLNHFSVSTPSPSFSFLFFVIALPLPLSLVWNSHAYTMGSSIPGLHFFVGVAMD